MDDLPEGLSAAHQAAFLQLRRRFCAGLPARWAQIASADGPGSQAMALHQLAGAAGSYGMKALDVRARQALSLVETNAPHDQLVVALEGLRVALEQAADTI